MRGLWDLTDARTSAKFTCQGHTYWQHDATGLWWSNDTAGHGGSVFKVYEKFGNRLVWKADADEYGDFIFGKHKGPVGKVIYLTSQLAALVCAS